MVDLYKYRIKCTTDNKYEYSWGEAAPTTCPVNTGHTIDTSDIVVVQVQEDKEVSIKEERTKTGGHFQIVTMGGSVPASTGWHDIDDLSFPFAIGVLSACAYVRTANDADQIECLVGPDTTIGTLTQDAASSANVLDVSQTVVDNCYIGAYLKLDDSSNTDDCGRITNVDSVNNQITVETATTNSFLAATPTYVKMTSKLSPGFTLQAGGIFNVGVSRIGTSYIPANTTIRLRYNNNDGLAKTFELHLEYLY